MKRIPLTRGQFAIVDDSDFEWLNKWKWCAKLRPNGQFYAARTTGRRSGKKTIRMHRVIGGAIKGDQIDHKNGDTLDNRLENLRLCTASQNMCNRGASKNNTLGFKGVSWHKQMSMWRAEIYVRSQCFYLGLYSSAAAASRAYKMASRQYHGEFART